jgi:hypothetical protein
LTEKKKLFEEVSSYLIKNHYKIIVDQVEAELASGVLSERKIPTLTEVDSPSLLDDTEFKRSAAAEFIGRQDYSETDALVLLLQASRRAIVDSVAMAAEVKSALDAYQLNGLVFGSEYGEQKYEVAIDRVADVATTKERARGFDEVIEKVRRS